MDYGQVQWNVCVVICNNSSYNILNIENAMQRVEDANKTNVSKSLTSLGEPTIIGSPWRNRSASAWLLDATRLKVSKWSSKKRWKRTAMAPYSWRLFYSQRTARCICLSLIFSLSIKRILLNPTTALLFLRHLHIQWESPSSSSLLQMLKTALFVLLLLLCHLLSPTYSFCPFAFHKTWQSTSRL